MQVNAVQTWDESFTGNMRWCIRLFPSLTDFAFFLPAFVLFAFLRGSARLLADGDTGWHIRTGDWILRHGMVPKTDIFSFSKPHETWFAWEWGWDVLFAFIHRAWGLAGVAFVNTCILCLVSALLFRLIRRCAGDDVLSLAFTILAVCGSVIHWLARPHLVSWVLVLVFLHVLLSAEKGKGKMLWWLPFLTALWTNLHGGFFIGILLVSISAAGELCRAIFAQETWAAAFQKARPFLICAAACSAATLINPYGWHLHEHIFSYLGDPKLLDNNAEFQSVSFHNGGGLFFEGMLLFGVGAIWWAIENGRFAAALCILVWAHLALVSGRNIPLFGFIASPWAAAMCGDLLRRTEWTPRLAKVTASVRDACRELRPFERVERLHVASMLVVLVLAGMFASGRSVFAAEFEAKRFPIQMVPRLETLSKSRIFTYDQWADYLIYRFPDCKVFLDGRSDFYGSSLVDKYLQTLNAGYEWESNLKQFAIDAVVIKPDAPLATVLKQSSGWRQLFDNGTVIAFTAAPGNGHNGADLGKYVRLSSASYSRGEGLESRRPERVSGSEIIN